MRYPASFRTVAFLCLLPTLVYGQDEPVNAPLTDDDVQSTPLMDTLSGSVNEASAGAVPDTRSAGALDTSAVVADSAIPAVTKDGRDAAIKAAIQVLETNLDALRDVHRDQGRFTSLFLDMSAKHPCDFCPGMELMPVENYAFKVASQYPNGFVFTHEVSRQHIEVKDYEGGLQVVRIPYTKRFQLPANEGAVPGSVGRSKTVYLIAEVHLIAENGVRALRTVEQEKPPGTNLLVLEIGAGLGLGQGDLSGVLAEAPAIGSSRFVAGVAYYFHPGGPNRENIWLRAGLRVMMRNDRTTDGEAGFRRTVELAPTSPATAGEHRIDVLQQVYGFEESVRRVQLQVPVGLSKRWTLNDRTILSLEGEVSYGFEVSRTITGRYTLDQTGTEHYVNGQRMLASGGTAVVYNAPDAALTDATGVLHEFYTGREEDLDDIEPSKAPGLGFALRPSVFLKQHGVVKYNVGLDLCWVANPGADSAPLGPTYFLNTSDTDRPSLTSSDAKPFRTFIGITLGIIL